ncbi:MAG: DNA primase small subunit domain-containing protein [Nanoarchaeota archaeon]
MKTLEFYSRKDIQKQLVKISKDREIGVRFNENFGKRPDIILYEGDVLSFAKSGATSFHMSIERWRDPLRLKAGMTKLELDKLRIGWDLIIDIDGKNVEYSKEAAVLIIGALNFYNIHNISVKFSGNKGLHIGIPFEAFPSMIDDKEIKLLFPDLLRMIIEHLKSMIKEHLEERIGKDPFSKVSIDTQLISNRHMFRAPYSLHEKTGLVSLPIKQEQVRDFDISLAKPENVKVNLVFLDLDKIIKNEAKQLVIQAFEFGKKEDRPKADFKSSFEVSKTLIDKKFFPPCINLLSSGIKNDGRKRALFILLNFLKSTGYSNEDINKFFLDWNKKNYEPLKEGYIKSQLEWNKRQKQNLPPPNCPHAYTHINYYKELQVCYSDDFCKTIKNPLQYAIKKSRLFSSKKSK